MACLNVCSLNVQGIRNKRKRKTLFYKLKKNKYDVICLQECHVLEKDIDQWEREWNGKIYYSVSTNHSKGQMILLRRNFPFESQFEAASERLLAINLFINEELLRIVNIYSPNDRMERRTFFKDLIKNKLFTESNLIVCGDFNCVLDNELDVISGGSHNENDVKLFQTMEKELNLTDLWRASHGDTKEYTWSRNTPFTARRLDYMFVSETVLSKSFGCEISSSASSDHRMVSMKYRLSSVSRGPYYWKFNDSLLHDIIFVQSMNTFIDNLLKEYVDLDKQTKWDLYKVKIKEFCITFSKQKQMESKTHINTLNIELNEIEKHLTSQPHNERLVTQKHKIKQKLEIFELQQAKSAQTRSREKYIADGEKNTKYFLNLEKVRANNKVIDKLESDNGVTITAQEDILKEQVNYYKNSFKQKSRFSSESAEEFTQNINIPQISVSQSEDLEKRIVEAELLEALKSMKNGTAPGLDGLTSSFYKVFWIKIKSPLVESLEEAFKKGQMSISQRRAVITLIHKGKNLSREKLMNWRPISLTNTDYKIIAKCLAFRMSKVIKDLVSEDQVGFIKGRKASTIIRLIDDVIEHMEDTNKPGIVFALDYSRAFDSISKDYILWAFQKFGFGEYYIKWVNVLMKNTESCINYNGWISEEFSVESGIRQGCPLSPMTFVLALELLAIKIRNDPLIKGIKLPYNSTENENINQIIKLAMYADDITMFLGSKSDLVNALNLVMKFTEISQLKINKTKSEAMWIGSMKNNIEQHCNITWKNEIKVLGIIFRNDKTASEIKENWTKRIDKIEKIISLWQKRNLNIPGKLCIIKSLLISQLVYPMQALIAPTDILNRINTILFRFLWKKRYSNTKAFEKVKRTVICNMREEGGLNMINIIDMQSSFTINWINQLIKDSSAKWKYIPLSLFDHLGQSKTCFKASVTVNKVKGLEYIRSSFWKQAFKFWLQHKHLFIKEHFSFSDIFLWNNKQITYKDTPLFFKRWIEKGINCARQIVENNEILSVEQIRETIGNYANLIFEHNAMRAALSRALRRCTSHEHDNNTKEENIFTPKQLRALITKSKTTVPCGQLFWERKYTLQISKNYWEMAYYATQEERLRILQWKILHNIFPTNILLHKMKIKQSNKCSFCNEIDYLEHFFWKCTQLKSYWNRVEGIIYRITGLNITLTEVMVLFGYDLHSCGSKNAQCVNRIILIAKMCISKFKYGEQMNIDYILDHELNLRISDQ